MMYKNEKNKAAVKILLSINPKLFQAIHYIKGFDFTKPFDIVSGDGKFTLNSIKKECENAGVATADTEIILFMELAGNSYLSQKKLYIVNIYRHKFVQFEGRDIPYNYNLDNFYSIGRFEDERKNNTKRWFVVIQKTEYLTEIKEIKKKKKIDFSERMMPIGKYTMWRSQYGTEHGFSSGEFKQGNQTYYINSNCSIDNPVDKSGYWLLEKQAELQCKAKALKAERSAAKAAIYDSTAQTEKIKEHIDELRKMLSNMILNDDYEMVCRIMWDYKFLHNDYKLHTAKIKNNQYRSVEQIIDSLSEMEKLYTKIITVIETDRQKREVS